MDDIRASFQEFFNEDRINGIAKSTGAISRQRKILGLPLLTSLAFWKSDKIAYADLATEIQASTGTSVTPQALSQKLAKSESFFEGIAKSAMKLPPVFASKSRVEIPGVNNIIMADSTTIALNDALSDVFEGTGGNGPIASMKVHTVFNLTENSVPYIALAEGKESEHNFKDSHALIAGKGDLLLRDLGYFENSELECLDAQGILFLSRIPLSVKTFYDKEGNKVNPWESLTGSNRKSLELTLSISQNGKQFFRVVAKKLPADKYKEIIFSEEIKLGRRLTSEEKTYLKWNLMVTNLSQDQANHNKIWLIYALRWQVELIFKSWKSNLGLDKIKLAKSERIVRAFVWAKLIGAIFFVNIRGLAEKHLGQEIGILRWFQRIEKQLMRIKDFILGQRWCAVFKFFRDVIISKVKPEKRRRKTSAKKLIDYK